MKEIKEVKKWENLEIKSLNDEDDFVINFVTELVQRRMELGMSQRKLAEISGIKQSAIARLESFRSVPQLDTIYKLLKSLNLIIKLVPK